MENYKIRVNNEDRADEAKELFKKLGYELDLFFGKYEADTKWVLAFADGSMGCASEALAEDTLKEITLPQLRDLVVLKRNDVKDANYRSKSVLDGFYFKSCDGVFYFMFEGEWVRSTTNTDEGLEPITKGLDLISGVDALRALADGKDVEGFSEENEEWIPIVYFTVQEVVNGLYKFRLKRQTIKLELEIPAPFQPKEGEECCYITDESIDGYHTIDYSSERYNGMHFGLYRPSDIKKVVALFRSALGG